MLRYLYHTVFYTIFNDTLAGHCGSSQKHLAKACVLKQQGANYHMDTVSVVVNRNDIIFTTYLMII